MAKQLRLEVIFGSTDKLSPALRRIMQSSKAADQALKKTRDQIKALNEQQKQIDGFVRQKNATIASAKALSDMENHVKSLRQQIANNTTAQLEQDLKNTQGQLKATTDQIKALNAQQKQIDGFKKQKKALVDSERDLKSVQERIKQLQKQYATTPSAKLGQSLKRAQTDALKLKTAVDKNKVSLQSMRNEMSKSGIESNKLAQHQVRIRQSLVQLTQAENQKRQAITGLNQSYQQQRQSLNQLNTQLQRSTQDAQRLKNTHQQNRIELQRLRTELNQAGLSTNNLSQHQTELRRRTDQANAELERQRNALRNLQTAQQNHQRYANNTRQAGMAGLMMAGTGAAAMYQLAKPINESKRVDVEGNRIAALGLGDDVTKKAIKYAQAMDTFGTSIYDNMTLVRDGITIFSDLHHAEMVAPTLAKMKFGNQAMFGHEKGEENERAFMDMLKVIELRGGLKSEKAFQDQANKIQQVITATGGRVQGNEWLNAIKTGGIAVKGMTDEALYYKMESIVQEWGGFRYGTAAMSAYQNIYQGRTTKRAANNMERLGLIEDPSKLKHDKAGQIAFLDVGAIKGAELFKKDQFAWMEQILLPTLAAKGITEKGDVLDAIGSIFTNRTASNLFADMYLQQDIINKSAKMNAGADNIDQLYGKAKNTTAGQELETKAKLHNAYLRFGQTILPIYTKALQLATGMLERFTLWMERNPTQAKILGTALVGVAAGLVAIGGLLLVFSPLILGMLSLRLMSTTLAVSSFKLGTVFKLLVSPIKAVGMAFLWLGRALLANPMILAITAIVAVVAGAAYLIYKNWNPIKAFFSELWAKVGSAFQSGMAWIKGIIRNVDSVFAENPILTFLFPLIGIPRLIIAHWSSITGFFSGVWSSIKTGAGDVWSAITTWFSPIGEWFSERWTEVKTGAGDAWSWVADKAGGAWERTKSTFAPAGSWFAARWADIKKSFSGGIGSVSALILNWSPLGLFYQVFAKVLSWFGIDLPARFSEFGKNIIDGLVKGLEARFEKLKTVWAKINSYLPDWMTKKNEIRSPSRLFKRLGGHIMAGWQIGIQDGIPSLRNIFGQALSVMDNAQLAYAGLPALPEMIDQRQMIKTPLSTARGAANKVVTIEGDHITLHVHQLPGQTEGNLVQLVRAELERHERNKLARIRSSMQDEG